MTLIKPMNSYLLVRIEEQEKNEGVYFGENKNKPKIGEILAVSDNCENSNFEVGKTVIINKYEMIPNGDSDDEFFVSEKAIVAMY